MKVLYTSNIYENPLPQLESKQSFFPNVCELKDGTLMASIVIGQAFESVDSINYKCFSYDGGKTWTEPQKMLDFTSVNRPVSDYGKITRLNNGDIVIVGYAYFRDNPRLPLGNPETGGVLDDMVYFAISKDDGKTFSIPKEIKCAWGPHIEASAPITELKDGSLITPITGFPDWNGVSHGPMLGRMLRSNDGGKSWSDDVISMNFNKDVTCFEQRTCQLESGTIVSIGWNEDVTLGERLCNHYTFSTDNGKTFSAPISTGIMGQASSVCAIGGEKLLALHSVRRDTDKPGVYAYVIDFSNKTWKIIDEAIVFEPKTPVLRDNKMAEIFAFLKFGQPSAIVLDGGDVLMTHWHCENGEYKTVATRISLK